MLFFSFRSSEALGGGVIGRRKSGSDHRIGVQLVPPDALVSARCDAVNGEEPLIVQTALL
jgi:hypothetical protein